MACGCGYDWCEDKDRGGSVMGEHDEQVCGVYPEHDFVLVDDWDGKTYRCRRCDAETWDDETWDDADASPNKHARTEDT